MRILIVEGDPNTANALYLTLMWEGYSPLVWDLKKPSQCLEETIKHGRYDIAIIDSHTDLPGGSINIRSRNCRTRIVVTTTDSKRKEELTNTYAPNDILIKPFSLEELIASIYPH